MPNPMSGIAGDELTDFMDCLQQLVVKLQNPKPAPKGAS